VSAAGDAQSDVMSGATIALMVLFVAMTLYLMVLLVVLAQSNESLQQTVAELQAEEQRRAEADLARADADRAKATADAARARVTEDLVAAKAEQEALAAEAARAARSGARYRAALAEAAGRELSTGEVDALAELASVRGEAARLSQQVEDAAARTAQLQGEIVALREAAQGAEAARRRAEAEAARLSREVDACGQDGETDGNLVSTGLKIWTLGGEAVITDAEMEGRKWRKRYSCQEVSGYLYPSWGGGGYAPGGTLGR
jgi:hypothetical protein